MKKNQFLLWMLMAAVCIGAVGCSSKGSINTLENADKYAQPAYISDVRFIKDKYLSKALQLTSVSLTPAPSGMMRAQITAVNTKRSATLKVNYKFTWIDEQGFAVETPLEVWRIAEIQPGETAFFSAVAPDGRCRDFRFNIKRDTTD